MTERRDVHERTDALMARPDPQYGRLWAVGAAWVDYDRDGLLDLLVVNYVQWDPKTEPAVRKGRVAGLLLSARLRRRTQLFCSITTGTSTFHRCVRRLGIRQSMARHGRDRR